MSIEYTIDIQLTELGFPDIVQLEQSPVRETPGHVPTSLPNTHKRSRDDEDDVAGPASLSSKSAILNVTSEQHGDDSAKVGAQAGQSESTEDDSDDSDISGVNEEEDEFDEEGDCEEEATVNNDGSQSGNYTCSVCSLQLSSKFKLQDHMNLHTGARPYRCAECGKCFCQNYNYRIHLRTHAQSRADRVLCRVCQMTFATKEGLELHLFRCHPEKEFYECDLCKRVFTSLMKCQSHVVLHKCMPGIVCEVCGRSFYSPKALARHHRKTCRRSFKCTDCNKTFNKKNALLRHSFSHLGLLPYTCVRCRCHFRLAKLYRQHKCQPQLIHCVACLREFLSETDFQQHKKDTGCWGNQEPKGDEIRCLECGELFSTSEELKKHAGAHQRVLKCAECGKGFRSALMLMSHMGGHAGNAPCLCQSCGLGFLHQQNYDSHLKTCGQKPQSVSASKKHQASKSSSSKTKTLVSKKNETAKSDIGPQTDVIITPAVPQKPESTVAEPVSSGTVEGDVSTGSSPSDGSWKLTLDSQPPPGVNLVLFLPVCSQTNGLPLSPAIPGHHGLTSTLEGQLNTPPDVVTGVEHAECETPLDLTKKTALSDISLGHIKNEPDEVEFSREADSNKSTDSKVMAKTNIADTDTEIMTDRSRLGSPSELKLDIKEEPLPHGTDIDLLSFESCQLTDGRTDKEIKVEVDLSQSTYDDDDKEK